MNNHTLLIENREKARISGVKTVERFSGTEVRVYTEDGDLLIKGRNLEVESCCEGGEAEINGRIDSAVYVSEKYHIPDNFLSRILK